MGEMIKVEAVFGQVIRELRFQKNLSQEKLAEKSNLDRTFISLLERGLRQPSLSTIFRIAKALEISPVTIVKEIETKLGEGSPD